MAGQVVQMDYAVIAQVSKGFDQARQTMVRVGKILQTVVQALTVMSFFGNGPAAALKQYLEGDLLPRVQKIAEVCAEFSSDLARAISDHQKGDVKGKSYFGEGIRA